MEVGEEGFGCLGGRRAWSSALSSVLLSPAQVKHGEKARNRLGKCLKGVKIEIHCQAAAL